jgi:flagellin-like protein
MSKQRRSQKAITPILATLLLIVIAVAAIVVTYAWIMTYMSNAGRQAGVRLYKANVSWDQNTTHYQIYIDIGNSGTSDTQIILVYFGTSPSNLQNQTGPPFPLACNAGAAPVTITINYNWTPAKTYYFKVLSSSGQYIDTWAEQAPVS